MLSIDLPNDIEQRLANLVKVNYYDNWSVAFTNFLKLQEQYGWKTQLLDDVTAIRSEIQQAGGITEPTIEATIQHYRQQRRIVRT